MSRDLGMTTLNVRTATLKHRIRDDCGAPGRQWFAELEERIEAAQAARRQPV